jgi:hypothetical protein
MEHDELTASRCGNWWIRIVMIVVAAIVPLLAGQLSWGQGSARKKADPPVLDSADPNSEPKKYDAGKQSVYAIWYDDGEWHMRVTAKDKKEDEREVFTGSVRVEGGRLSGTFQGLEPPVPIVPSKKKTLKRALEKNRNADWLQVHNDGQGFDFRFVNFGKSDGVNFKIAPSGKHITFNLLIGGGEFPKRVLIGKRATHPEKVPFTLAAHPEK